MGRLEGNDRNNSQTVSKLVLRPNLTVSCIIFKIIQKGGAITFLGSAADKIIMVFR